jgi:hypothetical protein
MKSKKDNKNNKKSKKVLYKPFVSTAKNKKYSVYVKSNSGGVKLIHFGDNRYEQYYDKIGHYSRLNHLDKERRKRYRIHHAKDYITDKNTPGWWSWHKLW